MFSAERERANDELPEELLARITAGDKAAESQMVNRYWRGLYIMLYNDCHDASIASDLTQDALCIALIKARDNQIREAKAFTGFIHQTAKNLLIGYKRKEKRQKTDAYDNFEEVFSNVDGPAQECERKQLVQLVQQVLNELPQERDRKVLLGYFVDGRTKAQLCDELDLSAIHFDRVLYRARQRLKQKIALLLNQSPGDARVISILSCLLALTTSYTATPTTKVSYQVGESSAPVHSLRHTSSFSTHRDGYLFEPGVSNDIS